MVFNTTSNNISLYIMVVSFIGGEHWSKPLTWTDLNSQC